MSVEFSVSFCGIKDYSLFLVCRVFSVILWYSGKERASPAKQAVVFGAHLSVKSYLITRSKLYAAPQKPCCDFLTSATQRNLFEISLSYFLFVFYHPRCFFPGFLAIFFLLSNMGNLTRGCRVGYTQRNLFEILLN